MAPTSTIELELVNSTLIGVRDITAANIEAS